MQRQAAGGRETATCRQCKRGALVVGVLVGVGPGFSIPGNVLFTCLILLWKDREKERDRQRER